MPFCIVKTGVVLGQFFFALRGVPISKLVPMKICPRVHYRSNKLPGNILAVVNINTEDKVNLVIV